MKFLKSVIFSFSIVLAAAPLSAEKLVIVHTNDTHSQIDPNDQNLGGVARRKVLIDSIRTANPAAIIVDCGDIVQGTPYFNIFKGEVEYRLLSLLGYDYAILGNHEFDNGAEALAPLLKGASPEFISTNYTFSGPLADDIFAPYRIKEVGGKKIAFLGINLDPKGMVAEGNYNGVTYHDAVKAANSTAWILKNMKGVDYVVALSHLGYNGNPYPKDIDLAKESEDIDLIIGGHSHTFLYPGDERTVVKNKNGRNIFVAQGGKQGMALGEITIDLDSLQTLPAYKLISIDSRLDGLTSGELEKVIASYRVGVDSLMSVKVGKTTQAMENNKPALMNFVADFAVDLGEKISGRKIDLAIMNKGGIRRSLPKGDISHGMILMMQPFNNRLVVMELTGEAILRSLDVMALRGGDVISKGMDVKMDRASKSVVSVTLNGKPIDPDKTYVVATIDYLANGGDYMVPLTEGHEIARSSRILYKDMIDYIGSLKKQTIRPDNTDRMYY